MYIGSKDNARFYTKLKVDDGYPYVRTAYNKRFDVKASALREQARSLESSLRLLKEKGERLMEENFMAAQKELFAMAKVAESGFVLLGSRKSVLDFYQHRRDVCK